MKYFWQNKDASLYASTKVLSVAVLALLLVGCATLFNSTSNSISFKSDPENANLSVEPGATSCVTPCVLNLPVNVARHNIKIELPDFLVKKDFIQRQVHWTFWINFGWLVTGFWAVIPFGIDWVSDNMWYIPQHERFYQLQPDQEDEDDDDDEALPVEDLVLPNTPDMVRIKEMFPAEYVREQITHYYGNLSASDLTARTHSIYLVLLTMFQNDDRLDLDEAVRRDRLIPQAGN